MSVIQYFCVTECMSASTNLKGEEITYAVNDGLYSIGRAVNGFQELFTEYNEKAPIEMYIKDSNEAVQKTPYGTPLKYTTDLNKVYNFLKNIYETDTNKRNSIYFVPSLKALEGLLEVQAKNPELELALVYYSD